MPSDAAFPSRAIGPALREAKFALRARCLARRDALPERVHAGASAAIVAGIVALPSWIAAPAVLLTLPFRSEWNTRPLVDAAFAAGKAVILPRVNPATRMLELRALRDVAADVELGYLGIPEPRATCPAVAVAAVRWTLVPGVAFGIDGARLGYGGGYYDRLLSELGADVPRVAGAFELQLADPVPVAGHDLRVDTIVTEQRTIRCADARA